MGRKKCKTCLSCFTVFYVDNERYYSCWLCKTIWKGMDDSLELVLEDPRKNLSIPPKEMEQDDDTIHNANGVESARAVDG